MEVEQEAGAEGEMGRVTEGGREEEATGLSLSVSLNSPSYSKQAFFALRCNHEVQGNRMPT